MKRLIAIPFALALVFSAAFTEPARRANPECLEIDDDALHFKEVVRAIVSENDPDAARSRIAMSLPLIPDSSELYFVADVEVCTLAAKKLAALYAEDTVSPRPVHLLRVGPTRYYVCNYTHWNGPYLVRDLFDNEFNHIGR